MTPQLQQAIRLLQLSNLELTQFIDTELERNPLLERDDTGESSAKSDDPAETDHDGADVPNRASTDEGWLDLAKPVADAAGTLDTDFDNVYPDTAAADLAAEQNASAWASLRQRNGTFSDDDTNFEAFTAAEISLKEHLGEQLPLVLASPADRLVGQYLIDLVDEAGYIQVDLPALAEKLGAPLAMVEDVLGRLQSLDPPGILARSLEECLALQLKDQNRYDPQIAALLANLDLLAARNLPALRRAVGVDMEELTDMIEEIKRLNPKPGLRFGSVQVQPVVPDVMVRPASDGSWHVELNSETLPRVLVDRSYYTRVTTSASSEQDRNYLMECLQTANWLVKSLDQRARTILRVSEEIVRQQDSFLMHGVQHLRPLNLKTVADAIKMHESTVSRVTSNKYMSTPRGIFELKYFFTSSIASSEDGEAHSSEAVRHRIRQLIDGETGRSILSDDKIVERLKGDGIDIARRTVAKYREAMRIPSSVQRRRDKRMNGYAAKGA